MKKNNFKNIIGYDEVKITLDRLIDILNNQEKYEGLVNNIPKGLLLYGRPGTGKTSFSNAIINSVNRKNFIIRKSASDGSFIEYMRDIFEEAKKNQPSIILLDDLDKFAINDSEIENQEEFVAVQAFLDDIKDDDIFVIATVNDKRILPSSLTRSGRFDISIQIDNPSEKDSLEIIKHLLEKQNISKDVNANNIACILNGSSCADLEKVCNQAGVYAGYLGKKEIGMNELIRASLEHKYDVCIEDLYKEDKYSLCTAYHEAGHTLVSYLLSPEEVSFVTITKTSSTKRGITIFHDNEYYFDDIDFMINRIKVLLAGKAATEIIYHKCDTGSSNDLDRAYGIVERLIEDYCMIDFNTKFRQIYSSNKTKKIEMNTNILITNMYNEVKEILITNRKYLDDLAFALNEKKILFEDDIKEIMKR